jgi:hypothetical protein
VCMKCIQRKQSGRNCSCPLLNRRAGVLSTDNLFRSVSLKAIFPVGCFIY